MSEFKTERRRSPRRYAAVADYKVMGSSESIKASQIKDISAIGICLIVYEDICVGERLEIRIYLPDNPEPILANGEAIWVKEFKVKSELRKRSNLGIEFFEIDELDRDKIACYVSFKDNRK